MPAFTICHTRRHGAGQRPRARVATGLVLALGLVGCDRAIEPYQPGEKAESPDLTRIFPEPAERSATSEVARDGAPAAAEPVGIPSAGDGAPIRGVVNLAAELEGRVPAGAVLFLIARPGDGGPPLAVQKVVAPELPLEFSIGPEDRMIQQLPFAGPVVLAARIDGDGNAMTREPGDLQGAAPGRYEPGASGVVIVIDEAL
jgi:hypothetical protein